MKKTLFLLFACLFVGINYAQAQITVKGTVISSENSEPVIGASILVKGTTNGTITDINGQFTLTNISPANKTIVVSFIGMETQEVTIAPQMKITLAPATELIEEVMVVAYGTAKKSAFTGSAKMINNEQITKRPVTNVMQSLSGQVAGLQITNASGQPGSTPSMLIRGIGSLNAKTDPLIILDGMPYEGGWNNINPADVESISVLKDAASNALYGARGANGVIMITTRTAKSGDAKVTVDAKWSVNTRGAIDYDYIKDPAEYYEANYKALYNYYVNARGQNANDAYISANTNMVGSTAEYGGLVYNVYSYPEGEYLIGKDGHINPNAKLGRIVNGYYLYPDNWTDAAYHNALRQEYNINISGGNEKAQVYGSFGYLDEDGIADGSDYTRISTRLKASYQAKPWMKFGANVSYVHSELNTAGEDAFGQTFNIAPIFPIYLRDTNGNIMQDKQGDMYDFGIANQGPLNRPININTNFLKTNQLNLNKSIANTLTGNAFVDLTFLKDFKFTFNAGTTVRENRNQSAANPFYGTGEPLNGSLTISHWRRTTLNLQQLLYYNHSFGSHNVSIMLGHESYKNNYVVLSASKTGMFSYFGNQELNGAINNTNDESSYSQNYNTEGYLFRGMYDYNGKYFFQLSYRRDASSRFHPDHRWGNFYSVGAAWLLSKENWLSDIKWIDLLKLKFSIGQQGNDNIDDFLYVDTYNIQNSNNNLSLGFRKKGNENITWETNTNINLGIEFDLFKERLSGGIEFFNRKTTDMLNKFSVPLSLGYSGYYDNIGDMNNKGLEVDLKYTPIKTKNIQWNIAFNATYSKNEISRLAESKKTDVVEGHAGYLNAVTYYGEGLPIYTYYMQKYAGVSEDGRAQWYYTDEKTGKMEKTTTYSQADLYLCGDPNPDVYGGFSTSLSLYGVDFSAQFAYSIGGVAYDYGYATLMGNTTPSHLGYNIHKDIYKAWTPENTNTDIPRWQFNDLYNTKTSDRFLTNASSLTLQNIQLGYTFPQSITKNMYISNLRIFFSCDNVYYWSKRKGFDPRTSLYGNGTPATSYSPVRSFSGGISLQF